MTGVVGSAASFVAAMAGVASNAARLFMPGGHTPNLDMCAACRCHQGRSKHELFAPGLAKGLSADAAHQAAGCKPDRPTGDTGNVLAGRLYDCFIAFVSSRVCADGERIALLIGYKDYRTGVGSLIGSR
jgi:hypothetical protein